MEFPELALIPGAERRFGGQTRLLVHGKREVLEHVDHRISVAFANRVQGRLGAVAIGALVVGVLDEHHRRIGRAPHGVAARR